MGALALAGCGGASVKTTAASAAPAVTAAASTASTSSETSSTPGATASTPARSGGYAGGSTVIARASAICGRRDRELAGLVATSAAAIGAVAERRVAIERAGLSELDELKPPRAIARDWEKFIADAKQAIQDLTQLAEAATRGEAEQFKSAGARYGLAQGRLQEVAKAAALGRCAEYG